MEMNEKLLREFTRDEMECAVQQISPLKSPRPNGYGACFSQST